MKNKFDANEWFVENEDELIAESLKKIKPDIDIQDDPLKPFEKLVNAETIITPKMAREFANKLNSSLCKMKRLLGIMSLITLILGIVFATVGIPICLLMFLGFII